MSELEILGDTSFKTTKITKLSEERIGVVTSEASWRKDYNSRVCDFKLKGKQSACLSDKQMKLNQANAAKGRIEAIDSEISNLQKQIDSSLANLRADKESKFALAKQGIDQDANKIKALSEGKATEIAAAAQAQVITEKAAAETAKSVDGAKSRNWIMIVVVVVIVIVIAGVVVSKVKKSKKK